MHILVDRNDVLKSPLHKNLFLSAWNFFKYRRRHRRCRSELYLLLKVRSIWFTILLTQGIFIFGCNNIFIPRWQYSIRMFFMLLWIDQFKSSANYLLHQFKHHRLKFDWLLLLLLVKERAIAIRFKFNKADRNCFLDIMKSYKVFESNSMYAMKTAWIGWKQ